MSYDLNGLGFTEIMFIEMYMPNTAKRVVHYIKQDNYKKAIQLAREAMITRDLMKGGA